MKSIDAVGMTVADMDRSVDFFSKVLSFEKLGMTSITVILNKVKDLFEPGTK